MSGIKILAVEDERIIARGLESCIRRLDYEVAGSVASGEEALEMARTAPPDLVFLDINLGKGLEASGFSGHTDSLSNRSFRRSNPGASQRSTTGRVRLKAP